MHDITADRIGLLKQLEVGKVLHENSMQSQVSRGLPQAMDGNALRMSCLQIIDTYY